MDAVLHGERLAGGEKRMHRCNSDDLPDGTMIAIGNAAYAVRGEILLRWSPAGYGGRTPRAAAGEADLLTPPSIVAVLAAGYCPHWHPSADREAN
jgi:hypothetical protein